MPSSCKNRRIYWIGFDLSRNTYGLCWFLDEPRDLWVMRWCHFSDNSWLFEFVISAVNGQLQWLVCTMIFSSIQQNLWILVKYHLLFKFNQYSIYYFGRWHENRVRDVWLLNSPYFKGEISKMQNKINQKIFPVKKECFWKRQLKVI